MTKQVDETKQGEGFFTEGNKGDKHFYIESYGCQMNFSDSEIVASILGDAGLSLLVIWKQLIWF